MSAYRVTWESKTSGKLRIKVHGDEGSASAHYYAILQYATWAALEPLAPAELIDHMHGYGTQVSRPAADE